MFSLMVELISAFSVGTDRVPALICTVSVDRPNLQGDLRQSAVIALGEGDTGLSAIP